MVFENVDARMVDDLADHETRHHPSCRVPSRVENPFSVVSSLQSQRQASVLHVEVHPFLNEFPYPLRSLVHQDVHRRIIAQPPPGDNRVLEMQ
jgi:hypothetical protein